MGSIVAHKGGRSWQSKCSANLRIGGRSSQQSKCSTTWGLGALDIPGVLRISGWRWGSQRSRCSINLGGIVDSSGALRIWLGGALHSPSSMNLGLSTIQAFYHLGGAVSAFQVFYNKFGVGWIFNSPPFHIVGWGSQHQLLTNSGRNEKNSQQCMCSRRWHRCSTIDVHMEC